MILPKITGTKRRKADAVLCYIAFWVLCDLKSSHTVDESTGPGSLRHEGELRYVGLGAASVESMKTRKREEEYEKRVLGTDAYTVFIVLAAAFIAVRRQPKWHLLDVSLADGRHTDHGWRWSQRAYGSGRDVGGSGEVSGATAMSAPSQRKRMCDDSTALAVLVIRR